MKRSWIGLFLLLVILGLGVLSAWAMDECFDPIADDLEQAAREGAVENWHQAAFLVAKARHNWEKWLLLRAALTDHSPMEDVDAMFAVLEVYGVGREQVAFSSLCREMAEKIQAIGEAHGLKWQNFL